MSDGGDFLFGDADMSGGSNCGDASGSDNDFDVSKFLRMDCDWNAAVDDGDAASFSSECDRQEAMRQRRRKRTRIVCEVVLSTCALVVELYTYSRGGLQNMRAYEIPAVQFDPDAYDDKMFRTLFRFERSEMYELLSLLKSAGVLEDVVVTPSRDKAPLSHVMCMLAMKYAWPTRLAQMITVFGRSPCSMSRLVKQLRVVLYERFCDGFRNPPLLTAEQCAIFSAAVEAKGGLPGIVGFIDGTVRPIARPGVLQGAQYNGKDRVHALKYQAVTCPDGIIRNLAGPFPGARHDQFMLAESGIMSWVRSLPRGDGNLMYSLYADQGYCDQPGLQTPFADSLYIPLHDAINVAMSSARITVEWEFGAVIDNWGALDWRRGQQLLSSRKIGQVYFVAALLNNCITCMRTSKTNSYFGVPPPVLTDYVAAVLKANPSNAL
jgi:nuclease HARBI1